MKNPNKEAWLSKKINRVLIITLSLCIYTAVVLTVSIMSKDFAQGYSGTVSYVLRYLLALTTGFIPFSVAEVVALLLPVLVIAACVYAVRCIIKKKLDVKKIVKSALIAVFCAFTMFVNVFGVCYFKKPLEDTLKLDRSLLSRQQLYEDALYTRAMLEEAAMNVTFGESGASENPHSYSQTDELVNKGYKALRKSGVFNSSMPGLSKKIMLSPLMTYTHISGMYMPFTGEANVNVNYPDYVVAFTIAHEKAHQRGVASEDEANFMAFLACMASGDDYLEYAALMNMYDYFLDATLMQDVEMYKELVDKTDEKIIREMYAYYKFFEKYSNSAASEIAQSVNDTYIKAMGDEQGVKSYGLVIELYHGYIQKESMKNAITQ